MKKFYNLKIWSYCLLAFSLLSCVDNEADNEQHTNVNVEDITLKDGYLSFKDHETFETIFDNLKTYSHQQRMEWEKELGFNSMKTIYEDGMKKFADMEGGRIEEVGEFIKFPNVFFNLYEDVYTVNTYREDISVLLN